MMDLHVKSLVIVVSAVLVLSCMRADRQTDAQTDADERLTPASVVGVSKKQTALTVLKLISFFFNASD